MSRDAAARDRLGVRGEMAWSILASWSVLSSSPFDGRCRPMALAESGDAGMSRATLLGTAIGARRSARRLYVLVSSGKRDRASSSAPR